MYLELPVCLPGSPPGSPDNLPEMVVKLKILPAQIVCYHESYDPNCTMIYIANGQPFLIALSMAVYESKIVAFWDLVAKKQDELNKRTNLRTNLKIN